MVFAGKVFQQTVGIPMGTNCAPLLADIFLYSYEADFIQSVLSAGKKHLASRFNLTYRYIDDVLSINNPEFENYLGKMYPTELEIKDTTESTTSASYQDLLLSIGRDGQLHTSIYDKRDDFNFHITHLVPSPILGLANAPIVETKFFKLAMSLLDFSPRIPLGTFSILLFHLMIGLLVSRYMQKRKKSRVFIGSKVDLNLINFEPKIASFDYSNFITDLIYTDKTELLKEIEDLFCPKTMASHCGQKSVFSNIRNSFSNIRNSFSNIRNSFSNIRNAFFIIRNSFSNIRK